MVMIRFLAVVVAAVVLSLPSPNEALRVGFYSRTCPGAEALVRQAVTAAFATNQGVAPGLVRLHFHDCFVRGCDASVLLDVPNSEKTAPPNLNLRGMDVIDAAKAAIEAACPRTVSCADILAFAARDASALAGNITWQVPAGRRDGNVSIADDANTNLPGPFFDLNQIVGNFTSQGLTAADVVTLSGAHSFGVSHCLTLFGDAALGAPAGINPNVSSAYGDLLRTKCPGTAGPNDTNTVFMDVITPNTLDNRYYVGVLNNLGLFRSDQELTTNPTLLALVRDNAKNLNGWANRFRKAMIKMGGIKVLEGTRGDIRTNCRALNTAAGALGWPEADADAGEGDEWQLRASL